MANNKSVRKFVIDSLKKFYQRLPLKKINFNGVEIIPNSYGVAYIDTTEEELVVASSLADLDYRVNVLENGGDGSGGIYDYAGYSYVRNAYAYILNAIYDNEYVTTYGFIQLNNIIDDFINNYEPNIDLSTYAKASDLNSYVKKSDLTAQGYLQVHQDLSTYVSKTELTSQSYVTTQALSNYSVNNFTSYAYIEERLGNIDLTTCVLKTELVTQSYAGYSYVYDAYNYILDTIAENEFITAKALINSVSYSYLNDKLESYLSSTYFNDAYTTINSRLGILEISSGGGGNAGEGGIAGILFNGHAATITNNVAIIENYTYDSTITLTMNNATVDTFTVNAQSNKTINFGNVVVPNDLNNYVSKSELVGQSYITSGLPSVSSSDNGKIMMVVNGAWALVSPATIYSGNASPSNANGNNGDIYIQS